MHGVTVRIGYKAEHLVTQAEFDISRWQQEYGMGEACLALQRKGEDPYVIPLTVTGGKAVWDIKDENTAKAGKEAAQFTFVAGVKVKKTPIFTVSCEKSIEGSDRVPDHFEDWLATLTDLTAKTEANAAEALASADIASMSATVAAQAASQSAQSADASQRSELNALDSAQASKSEADKSKIYAEQAQGALGGMTFVGFSVNHDGHVLITNSDRLGTASFELTKKGHMEVSY